MHCDFKFWTSWERCRSWLRTQSCLGRRQWYAHAEGLQRYSRVSTYSRDLHPFSVIQTVSSTATAQTQCTLSYHHCDGISWQKEPKIWDCQCFSSLAVTLHLQHINRFDGVVESCSRLSPESTPFRSPFTPLCRARVVLISDRQVFRPGLHTKVCQHRCVG